MIDDGGIYMEGRRDEPASSWSTTKEDAVNLSGGRNTGTGTSFRLRETYRQAGWLGPYRGHQAKLVG